jgi:hypothetical protein
LHEIRAVVLHETVLNELKHQDRLPYASISVEHLTQEIRRKSYIERKREREEVPDPL